ncbi:MAG: STAS domain-containing protein [Gemmataceae bacterium]
MSTRRRLEVESIGDVTVVNFVDRKILDEEAISAIGEQLFSLVDEDGLKNILLNFSNVEYLSSAALGKLITLNKKLQEVGGKLTLYGVDAQILRLTGLDKFFGLGGRPEEGLGGVLARLTPRRPAGGGSVSLRPPPPEPEG